MEQVSGEDREEYVEEALNEIGSKMKRKHGSRAFKKFDVLERENETVRVSYPGLETKEKAKLKEVALQLLSTGVVNTINVQVNGEKFDIFDLEKGMERAAASYQH